MDLLGELLGALDAAAGRARMLGAWRGDKARPVIAASLLSRVQGALAVHLTGDVAPLARVADEEIARWYAAKIGGAKPAPKTLRRIGTPAVAAAEPPRRQNPDWMGAAIKRAHEIIARDRERDLYPSQTLIAEEIAREFRAGGVEGSMGKPLTGAYIKRYALRGIQSGAPSPRSSSNRRGK